MPAFFRPRLALFSFVYLFAVGAWFVPLGVYMSVGLKFDGLIGVAYGMNGVATLVATLFVGMIADRYFAAQRMLGVLMIGSGVVLFGLSGIQEAPTVFLAGVLLHFMFSAPVPPLILSIAFTHLTDPKLQYPAVRAVGSVGWIVAGLTVGLWPGAAATAAPMRMAGAAFVLAGLYAFTLPHTPPRAASSKKLGAAELFGLDILRGNRDRLVWVFLGCVVLISIPKKFYDGFLNNFLTEKGFVLQAFGFTLEPTGVQTIGQVVEALTLLALPFAMGRLGIKWVMTIGMASWALRFFLFAWGFQGDSTIAWMVLLGIALHGLCYDFFFVAGQIWFDGRFAPEMRSRAQSLLWFLLNGIGVVVGSNIAGAVYRAWALGPGRHAWDVIWLIPASLTLALTLGFWFAFKDRGPGPARAAATR